MRLMPCLLLISAVAQADVMASNAWVGEVPLGSPVAAVYLSLHNTGPAAVSLRGITSPQAGHVMWHATMQHQGMRHMQHRDTVTLAPGERVTLQPGGDHLMLMDLRQPLRLGDSVALTLDFAGATPVRVLAPLRARQP